MGPPRPRSPPIAAATRGWRTCWTASRPRPSTPRSAPSPRAPGPRALEVAEPPSPRLSLDLNLYDAGLTLADAAAELLALHRALDAPGGQALLDAHGAEPLGHVAAGRSRAGAPFATIYFGGGPG